MLSTPLHKSKENVYTRYWIQQNNINTMFRPPNHYRKEKSRVESSRIIIILAPISLSQTRMKSTGPDLNLADYFKHHVIHSLAQKDIKCPHSNPNINTMYKQKLKHKYGHWPISQYRKWNQFFQKANLITYHPLLHPSSYFILSIFCILSWYYISVSWYMPATTKI